MCVGVSVCVWVGGACVCVCVCVCVRARVSARALRIVSMDKMLHFINTLIIIINLYEGRIILTLSVSSVILYQAM